MHRAASKLNEFAARIFSPRPQLYVGGTLEIVGNIPPARQHWTGPSDRDRFAKGNLMSRNYTAGMNLSRQRPRVRAWREVEKSDVHGFPQHVSL